MAVTAGNGGAGHGNRVRVAIWGLAALMLLAPLVAMQFTREVAWGPLDFAVFGAMLATACGAFELAVRMSGSFAYRAAAGVGIAAAFLLVWVNLAVGFIGDAGNPANLMFGGVLAVAIIGGAIAQFRSGGMVRVMAATALAQALAGVIAVASLGESMFLLVPTGFFVGLWLVSAALFRKAAGMDAI